MNLQESMSDKQIERNLWYIKNKILIKKIIIIILIIIIAVIYSIAIFKFIFIKIQDSKEKDWRAIEIDFKSWQEKNKPKSLITTDKNIIKLENNKYDLVIEIENPNERIIARELTYKFVYNNEYTKEKTTFILPDYQKKLIEFNIQSNKSIKKIDIEIIDVKWDRVNYTELQNLPKNIFTIEDEKINIDNNVKARNWIEFTATNISPYNWVEAEFNIFLYLGSKLVAVNQIKTNEFFSNEKKGIETSWFYRIPTYVNLKIEPEVNVLDKDNYIIN